MNFKQIFVATLASAAFALPAAAADVTADFRLASNPNSSGWAYVWTPILGGAFNVDAFQWVFGGGSSVAFGWSQKGANTDRNSSVLYKNDSTGLSATISHIAAVPEPSTYASLLAGIGVMGFIARRRIVRG